MTNCVRLPVFARSHETDFNECRETDYFALVRRKTVLVDDTPLAFLHQPNNGIPIFAFRSDPDDRFLSEAVLPLLQSLSVEEDVRPVVSKRFGMVQWFARNGFGLPQHKADGIGRDEVAAKRISVTAARNARGEGECPEMTRASEILLLMDFDKTMTLADAGESLIGQLAPELLPLLDGLEMPAPFVEATNGILAEMQRRGISRDLIVSTLRDLGQRLIPDETRRAVSLATRRGADVRILSDCNTVFISHMLSGAKIRNHVKEIISNSSAFERAGDLDEPQERNDKTMAWSSHGPKAASHRLVITPRHDRDGGCDHGCSLCPHNLCKGLELRLLRDKLGYGRIVYCGDGANDICPTLQLLEGDFVCVRKGHSLEYLCRERMSEIKADVHFWEDHRELLAIIDRVVH